MGGSLFEPGVLGIVIPLELNPLFDLLVLFEYVLTALSDLLQI
jgi:hypothetical protein